MKKSMTSYLLTASMLLLNFYASFAGVTGKIVGYVTDEKNRNPLPGANVTLENTTFGAATDQRGYYFIINVAPGKYSLKAQMIGYKTKIIRNVLVMTDLTTTINFSLEETVLEFGEEIVAMAERPLVQQDVTAKMSIVTTEQLTEMPLENLTEVLSILPGFTDASHLRGGRGNEVAFMIDGMYISDPLTSTFDDLMVDKDLVQELVVMSGTFNAEYGKAMSGVVNIVTKDPSEEFHGKLEYLSPIVNESPYRKYDVDNGILINRGTNIPDSPPTGLRYTEKTLNDIFNQWDRKHLLGQFRGNFSGGIPYVSPITFFISSRYLNEDSYLPFGYNLEREGMAKLVYRFSPSMKLSMMVNNTWNEYQSYSHSYKYRPENYGIVNRTTAMKNIIFTHTLSERTFYTLRASEYTQTFDRRVHGKSVDIASLLAVEGGDTTVTASTDYERPVSWAGEFIYLGDDPYYLDEETRSIGGTGEFTSQVTNHHLLKAGAEVMYHTVDRLWFQEPWVDGTHEYQDYKRHPFEVAAYIQDKIEYPYLILNLGFRLDYFDPKATMFPNIFDPGYVDENNEFQYYPEEDAPSKWQVSPRIGLAHPVTENLVFHFAYGHFFQRPDYQDMYYLHDIIKLFNVVGNPKMKAQRTQAFEFGVKQQIGDLFAVDFNLYYKDIFDLTGSSFQLYYPHPYAIYDNSDYANAKGFEITIQKRYSHYFSGNLNYTWLLATGNENSAREGANRYWGSTNNRLRPRRAFPLDWDRRHTFSMNLDVQLPPRVGPKIFGINPLANINANIIAQVKSGLPYTPEAVAYPELQRSMIRNSARMPWTYRFDVRLDKSFAIKGMSYAAYIKVTNLFDVRNVQSIYTLTGKPWDAGPTSHLSDDFQRNPVAYEAPRQIYVGIGMSW